MLRNFNSSHKMLFTFRLSLNSNQIHGEYLIKKTPYLLYYPIFKFCNTRNKSFFKKITFKKAKAFHNSEVSSILHFSMNHAKSFSTKTTEKEKLFPFENGLSEEETYLFELYNKKINLIETNLIASTEKTKFMNELLIICTNLTRHKNKLTGWKHLHNYFQENVVTLTNEEFYDFLEAFYIVKYELEESTWLKFFENFLTRKYSKDSLLRLIEFFSLLMHENVQNKFFDDIVNKLNKEDIEISTNEYITILCNVALNIKTMSEAFWKEIKNLEKHDFSNCGDSTFISLINLFYKIKFDKSGNGNDIYSAFRDYAMDNIHDFSIFSLPYVFELLVFMNDFSEDNAAKVCIILGNTYKIFPTSIKVNFTCALMEAFYLYPYLKKILVTNRDLLPLMNIPSDSVIENYKKERTELDKRNDLSGKDLLLAKKKIVLGMIDKLGFNKYYIQNYDPHSSFAYNELNNFSKKYKID